MTLLPAVCQRAHVPIITHTLPLQAHHMLHHHGWVLHRGGLLEPEVAALVHAAQSHPPASYTPIFNGFVSPSGRTDVHAGVTTGKRRMRTVAGRSRMGQLVASALHRLPYQATHASPENMNFLVRLPGCRMQDLHYDAPDGHFIVIALSERYGLGVVDRSHTAAANPTTTTTSTGVATVGAAAGAAVAEDIEPLMVDPDNITWLSLGPGDVVVAHARLLHCGGGNPTPACQYSVHAFYTGGRVRRPGRLTYMPPPGSRLFAQFERVAQSPRDNDSVLRRHRAIYICAADDNAYRHVPRRTRSEAEPFSRPCKSCRSSPTPQQDVPHLQGTSTEL